MICFHINKICSHIQKKKKKKKGFAYVYKKPTANSHDKFSREMATSNSCSKCPQLTSAANSHDKFLRQNPTAYYQICNTKEGVEQSFVGESFTREDKNNTNNKAKAVRINLIN